MVQSSVIGLEETRLTCGKWEKEIMASLTGDEIEVSTQSVRALWDPSDPGYKSKTVRRDMFLQAVYLARLGGLALFML